MFGILKSFFSRNSQHILHLTIKMSNERNQEYEMNTKSNLEIKLRNDVIAFKKVMKWAKTIRSRIEKTLQQLEYSESKNEKILNQQLNYDSFLSKNITQATIQINETNPNLI